MSQPQSPTDSQALVQSMLQRLKLQPGRESQAYLAPAAMTPVPTCRRDVNSGPLDDSGENGAASVAPDQTNGDLISNGRSDDAGGNAAESAGSFPSGAGRPLPAKSCKGADTASLEKTNGERVSGGGSATTNEVCGDAVNTGQNPGLSQSFTPRVYVWSLKGKDTDAGLHVGNGGSEASAPTSIDSSFRKKQRSPEKKAKRWTAKIRERWRDRRGSFGTKVREDEAAASNDTKRSEVSEVLLHRSPPDSGGPSETSARVEDGPAEGHLRSTADFDCGLGSFSLLEEITQGQEWARFFNPNVFSTPAKLIPSQETRVQLNDRPDPQSRSDAFNQVHSGNSQWSWGGAQPWGAFSRTEVSADAFSMEVSEGKQSNVHTETDPPEPMEDGQNLSDMQPTSPSQWQPAESGLVMRNRSQLTRKRHHQSAERLEPEKMSQGEEAHAAGASVSSGQEMEETEASQPESIASNSQPPPLSPSTPDPAIPPPRGVLKHSISRDSQSSMETLSKRRRVEENRHVHFSQEVLIIPAPEPRPDLTVSEADSDEEEEEEDSVSEQEVEHVAVVAVAPARRPALPQWILNLKRKNTGKRPR